ncbi:hypothetical protein ACFY7C_08110 [Streptomyces sp. NPDC012769]|uniref:hypothetical protein n=1 Tax=Streptomyces sp. NPDC012769 TaxID=3364848 RepID=UPI0036CAC571
MPFDTDFSRPSGTRYFRHLDGRPFTDEEQALADDATLEELQAAGVRVHNPEVEADSVAAAKELIKMLCGYAVDHHEALIPFMAHEDVLEYARLCSIITAGVNS